MQWRLSHTENVLIALLANNRDCRNTSLGVKKKPTRAGCVSGNSHPIYEAQEMVSGGRMGIGYSQYLRGPGIRLKLNARVGCCIIGVILRHSQHTWKRYS